LNDIPAWCRVHGHQVIETKEEADEVVIILSVKTTSAT